MFGHVGLLSSMLICARSETNLQDRRPFWGPIAAVLGIDRSLWLAFVTAVALTLGLLSIRDIRQLPTAALRGESSEGTSFPFSP